VSHERRRTDVGPVAHSEAGRDGPSATLLLANWPVVRRSRRRWFSMACSDKIWRNTMSPHGPDPDTGAGSWSLATCATKAADDSGAMDDAHYRRIRATTRILTERARASAQGQTPAKAHTSCSASGCRCSMTSPMTTTDLSTDVSLVRSQYRPLIQAEVESPIRKQHLAECRIRARSCLVAPVSGGRPRRRLVYIEGLTTAPASRATPRRSSALAVLAREGTGQNRQRA
jgi:hypothetical protein